MDDEKEALKELLEKAIECEDTASITITIRLKKS